MRNQLQLGDTGKPHTGRTVPGTATKTSPVRKRADTRGVSPTQEMTRSTTCDVTAHLPGCPVKPVTRDLSRRGLHFPLTQQLTPDGLSQRNIWGVPVKI